MEAIKLIIVVILLSGCSSTKSTLQNNSINPLQKVLSQVDKSIANSDCNVLADSIEHYYFKSKIINENIELINQSIPKLKKKIEKDKFIKKRQSDGCFSSYYSLIALKQSRKYYNLSNKQRVFSLFDLLKSRRLNNELIGFELTLLKYLFDKYDTSIHFNKIFKSGNEFEKDLILHVILGTDNIKKEYSFLNSIDFDIQSKLIQSIITLHKKLSLEELKKREEKKRKKKN